MNSSLDNKHHKWRARGIFRLSARRGIYPLIRSISERSYGIYLMHMFILVIVFEYVKGWALATPLTMILSAVITFTLCSLITRLISYLPKSKYIIG